VFCSIFADICWYWTGQTGGQNLLTALLVPYVALNLPEFLFGYLRSDIGRWIAFIAVVIRLFFAPYFPNLIHGKSLSFPELFKYFF
jgi:hypothetical protein